MTCGRIRVRSASSSTLRPDPDPGRGQLRADDRVVGRLGDEVVDDQRVDRVAERGDRADPAGLEGRRRRGGLELQVDAARTAQLAALGQRRATAAVRVVPVGVQGDVAEHGRRGVAGDLGAQRPAGVPQGYGGPGCRGRRPTGASSARARPRARPRRPRRLGVHVVAAALGDPGDDRPQPPEQAAARGAVLVSLSGVSTGSSTRAARRGRRRATPAPRRRPAPARRRRRRRRGSGAPARGRPAPVPARGRSRRPRRRGPARARRDRRRAPGRARRTAS